MEPFSQGVFGDTEQGEVMLLADEITIKKVAALAAYSMTDQMISDALMISLETVAEIKVTSDFRTAYAEKLSERANRAIDLEEGWDAIETQAIIRTMESLKFNTDPRFALQAAAIANRAQRRSPAPNRTIDASRAGNMIVLTMAKKFVDKATGDETTQTMVLEAREGTSNGSGSGPSNLPKRRADLPTPAKVAAMLKIGKASAQDTVLAELEEAVGMNGIDKSLFED